MELASYVEMDLDYCPLRYGETNGAGTCPAVLGVDSVHKCWNTWGTCAALEAYEDEPVTVRYSKPADYLRRDIEALPYIKSIDYTPARLAPGEGLGERAVVRIVLGDARHSDTGPGGDKYLADRAYDPFRLGTYWGKFRARRALSIRGRPLRLVTGDASLPLDQLEVRHFFIESFEGASGLDGEVTIVAVDALQFAARDRAQAPRLSTGTLLAGIDDNDLAATLGESGVGDAEYPSEGYINLGGTEIIGFDRTGDALVITRGQYGTTPVEHEAGERAQLCLRYQTQSPADVANDLCVTYARMDPTTIPLEEWQDEVNAYYQRVVTTLIAEPTAVEDLLTELIVQVGMTMWWDELARLMRLQVLRAIPTDAKRFDDSNVVEGTLNVTEQPDKQVTEVWTFFGMKNPLKALAEDNFRSSKLTVDPSFKAIVDTPVIKKIWSRWIQFGGLTVAERVNNLQLGRYGKAPRRFGFDVFRYGASLPALGQGARLKGQPMQQPTGEPEDVPIQIIQLKPDEGEGIVEAVEALWQQLGDDDGIKRITLDAAALNQNFRALHDNTYPSANDGDVVEFRVNAGVVIGSLSTSLPAMDVGTWPVRSQTGDTSNGSPIVTGVSVDTAGLIPGVRVFGAGIPAGAKILTVDAADQITLDADATATASGVSLTIHTVKITLYLNGRFQGKGGNGGRGEDAGTFGGTSGQPGGLAFYSRYGIDVVYGGDAEIFGGGGGGGGGAGNAIAPYQGGGGGGGAGSLPGSGGAQGTGSGAAVAGSAGTSEAGGAGGYDADTYYRGKDGGGPGQAGTNHPDGSAGGAAGKAVDGISYINVVSGTLDSRGGEIN